MKTKLMHPFHAIPRWLQVIVVAQLIVAVQPCAFGGPQLPANVTIRLKDTAKVGQPVALEVAASSKIRFRDGIVTLITPAVFEEPSKQVVLWQGTGEAKKPIDVESSLPALPPGRYEARAVFELKPLTAGARAMKAASSLFIEVRDDQILASDVSFNHIRRLELKREIDRKGIGHLTKEVLRMREPAIAEEIEKLNRLDAVTEQDAVPKPQAVQPASDEEPSSPPKVSPPPRLATEVPAMP